MLKLNEGKHYSTKHLLRETPGWYTRSPGCTMLTKVRMSDCSSMSFFQEGGESETVEENVL